MPTIRYCPDCGGAIEVPDDEEALVEGSVVRHERGKCPGQERERLYRYVGTFTVMRYALTPVTEAGEPVTTVQPGGLDILLVPGKPVEWQPVTEVGIEYEVGEGTELTRISAEMDSERFDQIAAELATKVGVKLEEVIKHAGLIDADTPAIVVGADKGA